MPISSEQSLQICNGCGEIFDANNDIEAIHHTQAEHAPLLPPRMQWRRPAQATMLARAC